MKSAGDRMLTMAALRATGLVIGLCALPFVDWPAPESWKWLALTAAVQFGYYVLLVRSYGAGDMSVVYPLARGLAPVLTTVVAARSLPLGPIVALRETSVIFGVAIGTVVLKEGFGLRRITAATLVVSGIALLAVLR